jgi:diadenosine tetraphosphate (Ap4A) HIT family hydrolase
MGAWPLKDHFLGDCGLTRAYVFEDQFFAGWTVLVLKEHVSELYELSGDARGMLMEEVSHVTQTLAKVFDAKKMNYELLGNQVPHIHWHLIPRLKSDPDPLKPVWCVPHEPVRLGADQLAERVYRLRAALRIDPNQPV